MDSSKKYLVTGGSGFLGIELIKRLTEMNCKNIVSVSRNEGKCVALKERFPHVEIILGNIADPYICQKAFNGVDGAFLLAAFKHVGLAERENVRECVLGNIQGSINLLEEARKQKPDFIIGISSDKAAQVKGVYGATKFIMERLFVEYQATNKDTRHLICRYGNVIYSTGSVLCKWKDKMLEGKEVVVTNREATRFFWTVSEAIDLIFECLANGVNSEPYLTQMKSIKIGDLLDAMMDKYGRVPVKEIGLQVGENMHESIAGDGTDSFTAERYTHEEILQLI